MQIPTTQIIIVAIFIVADFITGLCNAFANGEYKSSKMREGLWHKLAEIFAVGFGLFIDWALPQIGMVLPFSFFTSIVVYICIMEAGSIVENLGGIFPDLGKYLSGLFDKLKDKE